MSNMTPSEFIQKAFSNTPITPPALVVQFKPGDIPGNYRTYVSGYYAINDSKYGPVGTVHLRPRAIGANPWSLPVGSGVFLENYIYTNGYSVNINISSSASGTAVLKGEFIGMKVQKNSYSGNLEFGPDFGLDLSFEFLVGAGTPAAPTIDVSLPYGTHTRPESGSSDIGLVYVTGGKGKSIKWAGSALPSRVSGDSWIIYMTSTTPLGKYFITGVVVTAGGKDYTVNVSSEIEVIKGQAIIVPPPPAPEPEPVPVPVIVDVWGVKKSTIETVALGDADAQVQWVSSTTTEATGESRTEAEVLPSSSITDYLPVPKMLRPVENKQIKRSIEITDPESVEKVGKHIKRVRFAGVDSWGALQQYAEQSLIDAARCVEGNITIPCNPFIRAGDVVNYNEHQWHVERATHSFGDWTTLLTARRLPEGSEIGGIFVRTSDSPEKAIIRVIKSATGRVDNAVEGTITRRIDPRTYLVKVVGKDEEIEVSSDHVVFGDLLVGSTVLIGRGTI